MAHLEIKPNVFDCAVCHTPCNSESAKQNVFHISMGGQSRRNINVPYK